MDFELRAALKDLFDLLEGQQFEGLTDGVGHHPAVIVCRTEHNRSEMREALDKIKEFLEEDSWFKGELHVGKPRTVIEL